MKTAIIAIAATTRAADKSGRLIKAMSGRQSWQHAIEDSPGAIGIAFVALDHGLEFRRRH